MATRERAREEIPGVGVEFATASNPAFIRLVSGVLLVGCATALALSFMLVPDPSGVGTHRQLLFPPCWMHLFTGLPCPSCGMTTAFAHMARGQVARAFACHCLGPVAYISAYLLGAAALWGLVTGRSYPLSILGRTRVQMVLLAALTGGWVVNLARALLRQ